MTDSVRWAVIPRAAPAYEVSSDGRIRRRLPGKTAGSLPVGQELKFNVSRDGYRSVTLVGPNGECMTARIHKEVCIIFNGEMPSPLHNNVAHLNGDPSDNRCENLRWCTPAENTDHRYAHDTILHGDRCAKSKLTREQVMEIRANDLRREKDYEAYAVRFGVTPKTIARVAKGLSWRNLPLGPPRSTARSGLGDQT